MAKAKAPARSKQKTTSAPRTATRKPATSGWVDAGKGYELGLRVVGDGYKLVARKDGDDLASVPKPFKDGPLGERLGSAIDFLDEHARTCTQTVEAWMLRSLPVPRGVLAAVIADDSWRVVLHDAWVVPVDKDGTADRAAGGFFRGVEKGKVGVVDRDGETTWLDTELVMVPHPVLLDEVDDLRQMAVELGVQQGLQQLFREVFVVPKTPPEPDPNAIATYAGGEFAVMNTAIQHAKRSGFRVSGGNAICRVLERGRFYEARYDLGDGDPMYETTTGDLSWVDDKQKPIAVVDVPPVAFSEGMRMASLVYAKRKTEKESEDE
jgi:hypothetical protein